MAKVVEYGNGIRKVGKVGRGRIVLEISKNKYLVLPRYFSVTRRLTEGTPRYRLELNVRAVTKTDAKPIKKARAFYTESEFMDCYTELLDIADKAGILVKDVFLYRSSKKSKADIVMGVKRYPGVHFEVRGNSCIVLSCFRGDNRYIGSAATTDELAKLNELANQDLIMRGSVPGTTERCTVAQAMAIYTRKTLKDVFDFTPAG